MVQRGELPSGRRTEFWTERWPEGASRWWWTERWRGARLGCEREERGEKERREEEERAARRFKLVESRQPTYRDSVTPPALTRLVPRVAWYMDRQSRHSSRHDWVTPVRLAWLSPHGTMSTPGHAPAYLLQQCTWSDSFKDSNGSNFGNKFWWIHFSIFVKKIK
jgi:hypothetical protein